MTDDQITHIFSRMPLYQMLRFKRALDDDGYPFNRQQFNDGVRARCREIATQADALRNREFECMNKGHDWHVRSQSAYDDGYDEPMHCWRCGRWEM
jgi:hypothetical protein